MRRVLRGVMVSRVAVFVFLFLSLLAQRANGALTFETSTISGFNGPFHIITADFNSDTNQDLAVTNWPGNQLIILLGDGLGNYSIDSSLVTGTHPNFIAAGDFDNSGSVDLAITNGSGLRELTLFFNQDGTGTSWTSDTLLTDGDADLTSVVAANFTPSTDSNIDLFITMDSGYVEIPDHDEVWQGDGSGSFTEIESANTGSLPIFALAGDFNEDGTLDMAIANLDSHSVTIVLGNGDGTFAEATGSPITVGTNPRHIATGHLNGDAHTDLAVTNSGDNTVSILLGNGDGTFGAAADVASSDQVGGIVISDFDGDGRRDIVVARFSADLVSIYRGNGDGTFDPISDDFSVGTYPSFIAADDLDKDGKPDLAVTNYYSNDVTILLNRSGECLQAPEGMVSWWAGEGHPLDLIGTNHGILQNGVTYATGMVAQAFSFDGVDDYVEIPHATSLDLTGGLTLEAWVKLRAPGYSMIFSKADDNGTQSVTSYGLQITPDGGVNAALYGTYPADNWTTAGGLVAVDQWFHLALTWDGTYGPSDNVKLYLNGALLQTWTKSPTPLNVTSQTLTLGSMKPPTYYGHMNGLIDEPGIFNRALTAEEIAAIYAAGSGGVCVPTPTYTITGSVSGGHGTITCTSPVNEGYSSTCTITPDENYHLTTLTDNAVSVIDSVSNGQYVISNVTAGHEVIGTFSVDTFPLSITLSGTATGTVTSDPAGIDCGSTCDALFNADTLVTLTTTPATGSFFAGWSGDCSTDGAVTMDAAKSCTAIFTAYTALQVQAPDGGEDLMAGQSYTLRWGAPAAMETFDILYSLDGGLTWRKQAIKTAGNSYPWTLPVPPGTANKKKCLVRVIGYNGQGVKVAADVSDKAFAINLVRLDSHNGGQSLDAGITETVTWTTREGLAATTARVYYSLNKGLTWVYSGQTAADAGSYDWQVPLTKKPMTTYRVKVTLFNGATAVGSDKSDANFTIRTVEVLDPNGGETPTGGQPYDVSYHVYTRYPYAQADVYLSLDGGVTWKLRGQQGTVVAPGPATLSITLPTVATTRKNCKLKVQLVDEASKILTNDTSNGVFTIGRP